MITNFIIHIEGYGQIVGDKTNQITLNSQKLTTTVLPKISWKMPLREYTNSEASSIDIKASVTSTTPLKEVRIEIKKRLDEEILNAKVIDLSHNNLSADVDMHLFLRNGQNYINIVAENHEGGRVNEHRSVLVGLDALKDALAIDRKDFALLFATDRYEHWNDLRNPIHDAETIGQELKERYNFEVEVVKDASQEEVFHKLREYAQRKYKPQDQLFIFFAGHGQYDETFGEGYVVAKNSLRRDLAKVSYISHNRLRNNINNIPSDHIFLTMDMCFGGTFDAKLAGTRSNEEEADDDAFIVKKLSLKTRKFLTSGSKEYVSDGIAGQHSPFARKFIEALRTNGGNDKILTLTELNLFMERLKTTPRYGEFGDDEKGSDFLFLAR